MPTKPLGPGTVNVTVNLPKQMKDELVRLQKASGFKSLSEYIRVVVSQAIDNKDIFTKEETIKKVPAGDHPLHFFAKSPPVEKTSSHYQSDSDAVANRPAKKKKNAA